MLEELKNIEISADSKGRSRFIDGVEYRFRPFYDCAEYDCVIHTVDSDGEVMNTKYKTLYDTPANLLDANTHVFVKTRADLLSEQMAAQQERREQAAADEEEFEEEDIIEADITGYLDQYEHFISVMKSPGFNNIQNFKNKIASEDARGVFNNL